MAAYSEALANQILTALEQTYPHRLSSRELKARVPHFAEIPNEEWLSALDALDKMHCIDGTSYRTGFNEKFRGIAKLEITSLGRETLCNKKQEGNVSPSRPVGANVTQNFYVHGHNSRVILNSTDNSVNVASVSSDQLFFQLRDAAGSIVNETDRATTLARLDELERARGTRGFWDAYQTFIASVADYMSIFGPFIPALTQMIFGR